MKRIRNMPSVAVVVHPDGGAKHPVALSFEQEGALGRALCVLSKFSDQQPVAVIASSAEGISEYTKLIAKHLCTEEVTTCEGLLRDQASGDLEDGCDCVGDYLEPPYPSFGLVVVIIARDIAPALVQSLSRRIGKKFMPMFTQGMTPVWVA
ncbi:TPA: hypothetical protein DIV48_02010 [Candidatus Kaiserbacteria bacterium]|nr:MAG: hypothetical protein UY89_C0033G0011 [Parcubacteria group bacterium GW2011_GWA1_54_9]KKW42431.1 MAG: hypothetical protein UY91_C0003G0014 [Parcubacteria group bacterium GW2011_GWB1_55_9]HCR52405.1 hypothetical protein [Candidatus Kaiserbacteria bacterium]